MKKFHYILNYENLIVLLLTFKSVFMKKKLKKCTQTVRDELYESPSMEVIEMELEGPILQMSGQDGDRQDWSDSGMSGQDGDRQDW